MERVTDYLRYLLVLVSLSLAGCALMSEPFEEPGLREQMKEFERQHPDLPAGKRVHGGVI